MSVSNTEELLFIMQELNMSTAGELNENFTLPPKSPAETDYEICSTICAANMCSNIELTLECLENYIYPSPMEWLFISLHCVLFTVGVVGNFLVCFVVLRSKHMQTVTNLFIVNLAGADAVVLVLCLPPTVLQSVTETWYMGDVMCKLVIICQNTVVGVSVLTLCAIAVERYFAICRPLKSRITMRKVKVTILLIWIISAALAMPNIKNYVVDTFLQPELKHYLKHCYLDTKIGEIYTWFVVIGLYLVPLVIMAIFYLIISHHLWNVRVPGTVIRDCGSGHGYETHAEVQLASRKKVAKMLIAIVVLFAACYFPIHLLFILRNLQLLGSLDNHYSYIVPIMYMFSHWMCYSNSALNPLIYNFMSVKFKKEFRNVFSCHKRGNTPLHHESTWFHSSRMMRHPSNTSHSNTRILRGHDVTYPALRGFNNLHVLERDHMMNGESV